MAYPPWRHAIARLGHGRALAPGGSPASEGLVGETLDGIFNPLLRTRHAFVRNRDRSTRIEVAPARGERGIPLGERIRFEFRGLDGNAAMEAPEVDLGDRRRRLRKMGVS